MIPTIDGINNNGKKDNKKLAPSSTILTGTILYDKQIINKIRPIILPGIGI
jgi:hypothetical protein